MNYKALLMIVALTTMGQGYAKVPLIFQFQNFICSHLGCEQTLYINTRLKCEKNEAGEFTIEENTDSTHPKSYFITPETLNTIKEILSRNNIPSAEITFSVDSYIKSDKSEYNLKRRLEIRINDTTGEQSCHNYDFDDNGNVKNDLTKKIDLPGSTLYQLVNTFTQKIFPKK